MFTFSSPRVLFNPTFSPQETGQRSLKRGDPSLLYRGPGGAELPTEVLDELTQFTSKKKTGIIDVYWLYDDGGLTLLLPYIISTRRNWASCKLRVFALANRKTELEFEQRNMASLLAKFRIDYSDLQLLPDVTKKPNQEMADFFKGLIKEFTAKDDAADASTGKGKGVRHRLADAALHWNKCLQLKLYPSLCANRAWLNGN